MFIYVKSSNIPGSLLADLDHLINECLANFAVEPHQFYAEWRSAAKTRLFPLGAKRHYV